MKKLLLAVVLTLVWCPAVWAHSLWVNAFSSFAHPPGHALVTLGFGHGGPIDDLLSGDFGTIRLDKFEVVTPDGKSLPLPPPEYKRMGPDPLGKTLTVEKGDLGIRKLQFNKDAAQGTYDAVAVSAPTFFTQYVDSKGKKKMSMKPLDQIKDAKQVLFACKYTSYAKAPIVYKKWTEAKPLGHDLEIVPMVDTSKLRAGDLLPVQAFFMGKPLAIKGTNMAFVTASSKTFGGPDHFSLMSYLMGGKAQFRIPAAGQWLLSVMITRDVDKDPALADLKGKTHTVIYAATLNVNVNP